MITELQTYYREKGISAEGFHCPHFSICSRTSPSQFTTAKEAFVSSGYEKHILPRILFLSLDSGSASHNPAEKTLASVNRQEEIDCQVLALPRNKHWFRTHELAYTLLRNFDSDLKLESAKHHFAHANSAKCCQNNPERAQANSILFDNCRAFIPAEIQILAPDVLITQGDYAKMAVQGAFPHLDLEQALPGISDIPEEITPLSIGGRSVIWIHTYHPRNPNSKKNRDNYPLYEKVVFEFITKRPLAPKENIMPTKPNLEQPRPARKKTSVSRGADVGEGNYIYIDSHPPIPPDRTPTQAQCTGFEFMTMAQLCNIAEDHGMGRSRTCNAFGGDKGKHPVEPARMARASKEGFRKYVLVSAVVDYFKEKGVSW